MSRFIAGAGLAGLGMVGLMMSGCGEPSHDVPYYDAHFDARKAKVAQCEADPGDLNKTPNCINAEQSMAKSMFHTGCVPREPPPTPENIKRAMQGKPGIYGPNDPKCS